jgi:glucose-6-phosphate 1-epimerase
VPTNSTVNPLIPTTLPLVELQHPCGDKVVATLFGGHVLSWVAAGQEQFFLSDKAAMDGTAPIRGGVPVCFPQFNMRGDLPKHGFARTQMWALREAQHTLADGRVSLVLALGDNEYSRNIWPHSFDLRLRVTLAAGALDLQLELDNRGEDSLEFAAALHTYFAVDELAHARLSGLTGQRQWDSLTDVHADTGAEPLQFVAEFDRVFDASAQPLQLEDGKRRLQIAQSANLTETVVWNPHAALCAKLADMSPEGYRRMLCVEAAKLYEKQRLGAGQTWVGWQRLLQSIHACQKNHSLP